MESARNVNTNRCGCTTAGCPGAGQEERVGCQPQRETHRVACRARSCPVVSRHFPSLFPRTRPCLPVASVPALFLFLAPRKHGHSNKYLEEWAHQKSGHFPRGQNNTFFPTSLLRNSTMLSMTLPKSFQRNLVNFCSKPVNITSNWKQKLPVTLYVINSQSLLMWLLPRNVQVILTYLYYPKHMETKKCWKGKKILELKCESWFSEKLWIYFFFWSWAEQGWKSLKCNNTGFPNPLHHPFLSFI